MPIDFAMHGQSPDTLQHTKREPNWQRLLQDTLVRTEGGRAKLFVI